MKGLELFIDFEGRGYKTTLRAPTIGTTKRYVFNLSKMASVGLTPEYVSVAPIFLEGGKELVGSITSNLLIPYATINTDIETLVLNIAAENDDENFVIVLNESILEQDYSTCPQSEVEDPWGGCAISVQGMTNVTEIGGTFWWVYLNESVEASWVDGGHYIKVGGAGECINGTSVLSH